MASYVSEIIYRWPSLLPEERPIGGRPDPCTGLGRAPHDSNGTLLYSAYSYGDRRLEMEADHCPRYVLQQVPAEFPICKSAARSCLDLIAKIWFCCFVGVAFSSVCLGNALEENKYLAFLGHVWENFRIVFSLLSNFPT